MHLSEADVELIKRQGFPDNPEPEFLTTSPEGAVLFTDRGRRLYRLAMLLHGLSPEHVESVKSLSDLGELKDKLDRIRKIHADDFEQRRKNQGKVPAKAREIAEAARYGTPEELHAATERRLKYEAAGANVIPVSFRPRSDQ